MTLFARIAGTEPERAGQDTKISPHLITAVMGLFAAGAITGAEALASFSPVLDTGEQADGQAIFNHVLAATYTRDFACDIFYMTELGIAPYNAEAKFRADLQI